MDETTLGLHPVLRSCWMKKGTQRRIDTPGQQQWHNLFGAYNFVTDEVIAMPVAQKNSDAFVAFLDLITQTMPDDKPVLLVMDNASYHRSKVAQAGLAVYEERVLPLFLPPYCSDLNPIERYWRHLKDLACANKLHPSIANLVATVLIHLHHQNDTTHPVRFTLCKDL